MVYKKIRFSVFRCFLEVHLVHYLYRFGGATLDVVIERNENTIQL